MTWNSENRAGCCVAKTNIEISALSLSIPGESVFLSFFGAKDDIQHIFGATHKGRSCNLAQPSE
jgi:hypothetical protein